MCLVEIIATFFDPNATSITTVLALSLLAAFCCSKDATHIYFQGEEIGVGFERLFASLHFFFSAVAMASTFVFLIREHHLKVSMAEKVSFIALLAVTSLAYWPLSLSGQEFVCFLVLAAPYC